MNRLLLLIVRPIAGLFISAYKGFEKYILCSIYKSRLGYCGKNVILKRPLSVTNWSRIEMHDNTNILHGFCFISESGKLVFKKGSGAAQNLTVITGNHGRSKGVPFKENDGWAKRELNLEKDVTVGEDVWLGANVTLLAGVTIGRGATVGAGSVCFKSVPPYSIVIGNPARVIGFNFSPDEIIEHEKKLYSEHERLPYDVLEKNYNKYYINRINEVKQFLK